MGAADWIVIGVLAVIIALSIRSMIKLKKNGGCSGNCSGCGSSCSCDRNDSATPHK